MLTIRLINSVRNFVSEERDSTEETPLKTMIEEMKEIVDDERLAWTLKENGQKTFDYEKTAACDTIFRFRARDILSRLMTHPCYARCLHRCRSNRHRTQLYLSDSPTGARAADRYKRTLPPFRGKCRDDRT